MENTVLNLELTVAEVNVILATLSKHPFEQVVALINKIQNQGNPQIAAVQEAAPAAE